MTTAHMSLWLAACPTNERQVVAGDPFNSDPEDPEVMSEEVR